MGDWQVTGAGVVGFGVGLGVPEVFVGVGATEGFVTGD